MNYLLMVNKLKNSTSNPGDYYGEFSTFNFDYDEKINNIMVIFILIILLI